MKKHKLEILMGIMLALIIGTSLFLRNKVIIIRTPILIRSEWPAEDNWAEDKLREMILESIEERNVSEPEPQGMVINTQLVSSHSKNRPGVYAKIVKFFGKDSRVVGELLARESSMNPLAINPTSGACGLFQSLPCEKMGCSLNDIDCQMRWGKQYIENRYGSPEGALAFWRRNGWY